MSFTEVPLRRLAECLDGKRIPMNREQRAGMAGDVPYWGSGGIVDHIDQHLFDEPLVLLGEDGAPFFDKRRPVSFLIQGRSWVNNHIHVLRPRAVDPRFLSYALNAVDYGAYISGSTRDKLTQEEMWTIRVPNPHSDEQRRIADFLDEQTGRIDRVLAGRQQQLSMLAEQTVAAVSDILAPPSRADEGHADTPWLSPTTGALTKLGFVCRLQSGVTVDASRTEGSEYPYLRVANVQDGSLNMDEVKRIVVPEDVARRSLLRAGDVLMTEGGDIDKLGRGSVWHGEIDPCLHQNHVFALRPDPAALLPEYLAAMTRTHHARCYFESTGSQSTNLASTNSSKVLAFRFPLPPLAIQAAKLCEVRVNDEHADRLLAALQTQIALLQERKQALITAAVTGQFDVTTARAVA